MNTISINVENALRCLTDDLGISKSTTEYLCKRYKCEGIKFLTVTLPKLSDCLLSSLEKGFFDFSSLTSFRWKSGALANFCELTDLVFYRNGYLRPDACEIAVWRIRQLSQYFYKLALEFTDDQIAVAQDKFVSLDNSISTQYDEALVQDLRKSLESNYSFPQLHTVLQSCRPRFGPGTFSDHSSLPVAYYNYKESIDVTGSYPKQYENLAGYFKPYPGYSCDFKPRESSVSYSEVLFVPKDSRGPRTIVREPSDAIQLQMSFFDFFSQYLQKETNGRINFTDQSVNQRLAKLGSVNGCYATLDLKDASDSVSYRLIYKLFENVPCVRYFLKVARTKYAKLPSGQLHKLAKLAGMGSGFTFPMMAFLAHHSIACRIAKVRQLTYREASKHIYVYGDDIIIPNGWVSEAYTALTSVGLKPNINKSFSACKVSSTRKLFRESCGGDYFDGCDVSTVKLRLANSKPVNNHINRCVDLENKEAAIVQLSKHAKECVQNGLLKLSAYYYAVLEKVVGKLPLTNIDTGIISRFTRQYVEYKQDSTGAYETIKVLQVQPKFEEVLEKSPYACLAQSFKRPLSLEIQETTREIQQYVVSKPRALTLKRVRVSALALI